MDKNQKECELQNLIDSSFALYLLNFLKEVERERPDDLQKEISNLKELYEELFVKDTKKQMRNL